MSLPDAEEARILQNFIRNPISLRLFSNNITLSDTTTLASFVEVVGPFSYAPITLTPGFWNLVSSPPDPYVIAYAPQTFNLTYATSPPNTIYGYYLVDMTTGLYIGGENFAESVSPFVPVRNSHITISLRLGVS